MATYTDAAGRQRSGRIVAHKMAQDGTAFLLVSTGAGAVWVRSSDCEEEQTAPPSQQLSCFV